jgi:hypothetical protein
MADIVRLSFKTLSHTFIIWLFGLPFTRSICKVGWLILFLFLNTHYLNWSGRCKIIQFSLSTKCHSCP